MKDHGNDDGVTYSDDICAATPDKDDNDWFPLLTRTKMDPNCDRIFDK